MNNLHVCVDVSPLCDMFNPSNGHCITCKSGSHARQGICCPAGLFLSKGTCVDPSTLSLAGQATGP